jgi:4-amino-4-deoxychorismate lyase
MSEREYLCFLNGEQTSAVSAKDRGLAYGHGLFETIRLADKSAPFLRYHLSRLISGANRLGLVVEPSLLERYIDQLVKASPADGIIKIIVTGGCGERGYHYRASAEKPTYLLQWLPFVDCNPSYRQQGIALKHCRHRLPYSPVLAGIKHLNRLDQVMARAEWDEEFVEGLMQDQQGNVVEGVSSNLFIYQQGSWLTPNLNQCGVSGVMRQYLLEELLPRCSFHVVETNISFDQLLSAEEVFVCNSIVGIWPVLSLEEEAIWPLGQNTLKLQGMLYQEFPCYG